MSSVNRSMLISCAVVIQAPALCWGQGLIGCVPPTGVDPDRFVCLDNYADEPDLVYRNIGDINFTDNTPYKFVPFVDGTFTSDPALINTVFNAPYGDRLGYEATGLFDVDGDGYNDWSTAWYDAEPVRTLDGSPRAPQTAYVLPAHEDLAGNSGIAANWAELVADATWDKVGMVRVFSGRDNQQIGQEIWGHSDQCLFPHEIAPLRDIDGDGRDELMLSANTTDGSRGSVNVMAFTNRYNERDSGGGLIDTTERWVCIMRIVGRNSLSEFAYELEDAQSDFNNDGQNDIVAASKFWRSAGSRPFATGAGWIFLTPPVTVFAALQATQEEDWFDGSRNAKKPIVLIAEDHYNLCVMQLDDNLEPIDAESHPLEVYGTIGDIADAGDLDGDGNDDLAVTGAFAPPGQDTTGAIYFLLSGGDGFGAGGYQFSGKISQVLGLLPDGSLVLDETSPEAMGVAIDVYQDAELVVHGDASRSFLNNLRSYFGLNLDDSHSGADTVLITYDHTSNRGEASVLLDGPGGSLEPFIASAIPAQRPTAVHIDSLEATCDVFISRSELLAPDGTEVDFGNITSFDVVGNFDGDAGGDHELSITTVMSYALGTGNQNFAQISTASVLDIPTDGGEKATVLYSVQHETPRYHAAEQELIGYEDPDFRWPSGMNWKGLIAEVAWDLDGDGRDDLLLHTASTPGAVLEAPDPSGGQSKITLFSEQLFIDAGKDIEDHRPYQVGGQENLSRPGQAGAGSTHVVLSPPPEPELVMGYASQITGKVYLLIDGISPETGDGALTVEEFKRLIDNNEFVVELAADPDGPTLHTRNVEATYVTGVTRILTIEFEPIDLIPSHHVRVRSRWTDDDDVPFTRKIITLMQ